MNRVSKSCALLALITLVFSCSSAPPAEEGMGLLWEASGEARLLTARKQAPLVVLEDGRVLAAGGKDGPRTLRSSEVYEPEEGAWRATGRLNQERREHAAVRLKDGRVLVMGGMGAGTSGALTSAEVYEPEKGEWTRVEDMHEARTEPSAVVLEDGRVLVAGGFDEERNPVLSAEVYEPETGEWTRTGAPGAARGGARAGVVLEDGRVLFVSGLQAEVYEPETGEWRKAGPVGGAAGTHRTGHSVTKLEDGRVLVVGGSTSRAAATAEVYEPEKGEWRLVAAPGAPREGHGAVVLEDGRVLVVGGYHASTGALASVEQYDPETDTWSAAPALRVARRGAGVVVLEDGEVLVVGGANDLAGTLGTSERYAPVRCVARTCEGQGGTCGAVPDGCGGTLECGPCEVAQGCGAEGCTVEAEYDEALRAPRCARVAPACNSGLLLVGRGELGPEMNAPNTLYGACADGAAGQREEAEALDGLRVSTLDGSPLAPGKEVRVEASVWAYENPEENRLDLYYAADAREPAWTYLTTLTPGASGGQVMSATYELPAGALQAVRGVFRYAGSAEPCPGGTFDDVDDLVFPTQ